MSAGTGDVTTDTTGREERACGTCGKHKCGDSPQSVLSNGNEVNCQDWTKKTIDLSRNKPQPQVAPLGDFSTCLLNIEKSLSGLADVAESKSVTLGDAYGKLADGCIDAMESVQVLRNQANGIEMDEEDAI